MMTCDDVRTAVYVYLDDEFSEGDSEVYAAHLESCESCRAFVERESRFLTDLRDKLAAPPMPEDVRARILDKMTEVGALQGPQAPSNDNTWSWVGVPLAIAAGVLLTLSWWPSPDTMGVERPTVRHAVAAHQSGLPMEIEGGEERVRTFVKANVPFAAKAPLSVASGLKLVGARLTQVEGKVAVLYRYDHHGRELSVLQAPGLGEMQPNGTQSPVSIKREGFGVVTFSSSGVENAVVGNLGEDEMLRLVPKVTGQR